jgi:uncharacterized protein YjbJ (UPF0337 family)
VLSVLSKRNAFLGDADMNKDNFEGGVRSVVGQGERFVGAATGDKTSEVKGAYNEVAGSAQSASNRD